MSYLFTHFFTLALLFSSGIVAETKNNQNSDQSLELELDSLPSAQDDTDSETAQLENPTDITRRKKKKKFCSISVSQCARVNSLVVCCNALIRGNLAVAGNTAIQGNLAVAGGAAFASGLTVTGFAIPTGLVPLFAVGNSAEPRLNLIRGTVDPLVGSGSSAVIRGAGYTAIVTAPGTVAVTFSVPFASAPTVLVSDESSTGAPLSGLETQVTSVTATGFTLVNAGIVPAGSLVNFIAIAPVA